LLNDGPGSTQGALLRVQGVGAHTGNLIGAVIDMRPLLTTNVAVGMQIMVMENLMAVGIVIGGFAVGVPTCTVGFDVSASILMGTAAFRYSQKATSLADFLRYVDSAGANAFTVDYIGNVNLDAGKVLRVASLPVVGARRTGWSNWSGTASRGTRSTSTATVVQVAEALKALIDDLHAVAGHGLIGN
jgi:hypothetical protein